MDASQWNAAFAAEFCPMKLPSDTALAPELFPRDTPTGASASEFVGRWVSINVGICRPSFSCSCGWRRKSGKADVVDAVFKLRFNAVKWRGEVCAPQNLPRPCPTCTDNTVDPRFATDDIRKAFAAVKAEIEANYCQAVKATPAKLETIGKNTTIGMMLKMAHEEEGCNGRKKLMSEGRRVAQARKMRCRLRDKEKTGRESVSEETEAFAAAVSHSAVSSTCHSAPVNWVLLFATDENDYDEAEETADEEEEEDEELEDQPAPEHESSSPEQESPKDGESNAKPSERSVCDTSKDVICIRAIRAKETAAPASLPKAKPSAAFEPDDNGYDWKLGDWKSCHRKKGGRKAKGVAVWKENDFKWREVKRPKEAKGAASKDSAQRERQTSPKRWSDKVTSRQPKWDDFPSLARNSSDPAFDAASFWKGHSFNWSKENSAQVAKELDDKASFPDDNNNMDKDKPAVTDKNNNDTSPASQLSFSTCSLGGLKGWRRSPEPMLWTDESLFFWPSLEEEAEVTATAAAAAASEWESPAVTHADLYAEELSRTVARMVLQSDDDEEDAAAAADDARGAADGDDDEDYGYDGHLFRFRRGVYNGGQVGEEAKTRLMIDQVESPPVPRVDRDEDDDSDIASYADLGPFVECLWDMAADSSRSFVAAASYFVVALLAACIFKLITCI